MMKKYVNDKKELVKMGLKGASITELADKYFEQLATQNIKNNKEDEVNEVIEEKEVTDEIE